MHVKKIELSSCELSFCLHFQKMVWSSQLNNLTEFIHKIRGIAFQNATLVALTVLWNPISVALNFMNKLCKVARKMSWQDEPVFSFQRREQVIHS